MEKVDVKVQKLNPNAIIPAYQTPGAAAVDICACLDTPVVLYPGQTALIPTGIAIECEPGVVALLFARSGLAAKNSISLANSVGVIDSDYRGEVKVALVNRGQRFFTVNHGDRIAQMGFFPVYMASLSVSDSLSDTERGNGGFGHTGV
ncbi:MAG: dUTP diphosphatase [Ruminococcaceae bacterium]|nr:dUTP diphosphatase [Oscillospiraceae bacterium]